jgi:hypothetical protein
MEVMAHILRKLGEHGERCAARSGVGSLNKDLMADEQYRGSAREPFGWTE